MKTILFQGDSITDTFRIRNDINDLGIGYVSLVPSLLKEECRIINKGISGETTTDILKRWDKECIDLKPDILCMLMGINDTWRKYDSNMPTTLEQFARNIEAMLSAVREKLPNTHIIIAEPYVVHTAGKYVHFREDLDPKIRELRRLAVKYKTDYIPLDGLLASAATRIPMELLSEDCIHPSEEGTKIIAQCFAKAINNIL